LAPALALAACSGSTQSSTADHSAKVEAPSSLVSSGALTVTADFQGPPFDYVEGTTKKGFDVEFDKAAADLLGVKLKLVDTRFSSLIPSLQAGRADAIISVLYITQERLKTVDMVPYAQTGSGFLVKTNSKYQPKEAEDLCGKSVAVLAGGFEESMASGMLKKNCQKNSSTLRVKSFPSDVEATGDVAAGRSDVFFTNFANVTYRARKFTSLHLGVSNSKQLFPIPAGIAVRKDRPEVRKAFQKVVSHLTKSGELGKLVAKYGLELPDAALVNQAREGALYQ
jgi:ABC-type amino acid transport substrate-binding protein